MEYELELDSNEYESLKRNSDLYNEEYKNYIDELIYENRIIDKQLDAELYIYTNLNINPNEFNITKIKSKLNVINNYVKYLEMEAYINE